VQVPDWTNEKLAESFLHEAECNLCHTDGTAFFKRQKRVEEESIVLVHYCGARARFKCQFEIKICVHFEPFSCAVFKSETHDHTTDHSACEEGKKKSKSGTWGIALHLRPFIQQQVLDDKSPTQIMRALRDEKLEPKPTMQQLRNFVASVRKSLKSDLAADDIGSFIEWIQLHQFKESLADDELFVLPKFVVPEALSYKDFVTIPPRIVCSFSTRKLLENAVQKDLFGSSLICIDGTYNLVANSWPVLVFGTVDIQHRFRLIAVALASSEDETCFKAAMESVSAGITQCFPGNELAAEFTMQDGSKAIYNATQQVLKPKIILSCWFHVKQAVVKRKHEFRSQENYELFIRDLDSLQASVPHLHHVMIFVLCKLPSNSFLQRLLMILGLLLIRHAKHPRNFTTVLHFSSKNGQLLKGISVFGLTMSILVGGKTSMPVFLHRAFLARTTL
jgi:hypothetical protein